MNKNNIIIISLIVIFIAVGGVWFTRNDFLDKESGDEVLLPNNESKGKCGDGVCGPVEKANPSVCPQDCKAEQNLNNTKEVVNPEAPEINEVFKSAPYYFVAVHNEPARGLVNAKAFGTLESIVKKATENNIKLTIMLTPSWVDYIVNNSAKMAEVKQWQSSGHEIAGHHHDLNHVTWDGYSYYPKEYALACRETRTTTVEKYLGTLNDYVAKLRQVNPLIKTGCSSDTEYKNFLPDGIIYDTCSGFANFGEPGVMMGDGESPQKGKNEYITTGNVNGIKRKWLSHYAITSAGNEAQAESLFGSLKEPVVYGVVAHSFATDAEQLYKFIEFLHSKDPKGERSKTVSGVIEQNLVPEKNISDALLNSSGPNLGTKWGACCGDKVCDTYEKLNPGACSEDCN